MRRSTETRQVRMDVGLEGTTVVLPEGQEDDPEAVLRDKESWILKQRDRFERYRAQMPDCTFEEGEAFPVLGAERTVDVEGASPSRITDEEIHLDPSWVEVTSIRTELERFYREEARRHFTERAEHFSKGLGVEDEQIQIRNQKTRWGSYST